MNLQSVNLAVVLIGSLVVLLSGGGIVLFSLTTLIITVAYVITYGVIAHKVLQESKEFKGQVLLADIKAIFHKGFGYLLSPVWQAVFFQGTTFVVRIVLGPVAVTVFNTVRTLTRAVNQANAMVISSVLPELQFEIGAGNLPQARKIFRFGLMIITLIALAGMIFLFFGGPWFYEIWTRKALNPPAMMWNIFIVGILFSGIWWMSSDVLIAANKPYEFTIAGTIVAAIAVLASYVLSIHFGLTGAAIGSLILDVLLFVYVLPRSCKLIEQQLGSLIRDFFSDCRMLWNTQMSKLSK
jgi:O-antigen/teichoic acid export membrane protein